MKTITGRLISMRKVTHVGRDDDGNITHLAKKVKDGRHDSWSRAVQLRGTVFPHKG